MRPSSWILTLCSLVPMQVWAAQEGCLLKALDVILQEGRVISHNEPFLGAFNYFDGGGVCGPVCAVNLLRGIEAKTGVNLTDHAGNFTMISGIQKFVSKEFNYDIAQKGMKMSDIETYLKFELDRKKIPATTERQFIYQNKMVTNAPHISPTELIDIMPDSKKAFILGVFEVDDAGKATNGHAILLQSINRESHTITIIDPNFGYSQIVPYRIVNHPRWRGQRLELLMPDSLTENRYLVSEACIVTLQ